MITRWGEMNSCKSFIVSGTISTMVTARGQQSSPRKLVKKVPISIQNENISWAEQSPKENKIVLEGKGDETFSPSIGQEAKFRC